MVISRSSYSSGDRRGHAGCGGGSIGDFGRGACHLVATKKSSVEVASLVTKHDILDNKDMENQRIGKIQGPVITREVEHTRNKCLKLYNKTSQVSQFAQLAHASER